ncbi:ankrd52 [Symbiodinium necroappetens]|uniref:Ankrd52 protein n=1 Tax=Symbiodinium necroappetens TaxID=1628268 RepID=A0A812NRS2_9DINO|nr:ankrd52 [Symbiodinium necroappetens]
MQLGLMDPGWTGSGLLDASHLPLLRVLMLWVWKASGEELASISKAELAQMAEEDGLPVRAMKRHLHQLCRQPRFRQRLLWADGSELTDNLDLDDLQAGLQDLQLVLLPCAETSSEQISELAEAVRNDSVLDVEAILHRPQDPDLGTALHEAAVCGSLEVAALLVEAGASIDKEGWDPDGQTPLHLASAHGHLDVVRFLVHAGAEKSMLENQGQTPLHLACSNGHLDVVRFLLLGEGPSIDMPGPDGNTPLHLASATGHLDEVRFLVLDAGANVHVHNDDEETPVHLASSNGRLEVIRFLVKDAGADIDALNIKGRTPLHLACAHGRFEIARFLVAARADIDKKDDHRLTALEHASSCGNPAVVSFLVQAHVNKEVMTLYPSPCAISRSMVRGRMQPLLQSASVAGARPEPRACETAIPTYLNVGDA